MLPFHLKPKRLSPEEREARKVAWRADQAFRERRRYGTLGAGSECRRIDPQTGEVVGIVERDEVKPSDVITIAGTL
ncbi:hypothetical protein [Rhodoplanes azumiensis]|uniref:Uncharacterized protein n=1 Tax=Rhodoplanes azumiensis TaxID=1897628 RepID=A0ABW5AML0_9BRAD